VASSAIFKHPDGITAGVNDFREAVDKAAAKHKL
jgi:ribulose 1,5-bisphosphate carboxylase large subunit-like protein